MKPDKLNYIMDSYAFLAYLGNEKGVNRIREILSLSKEQRIRLIMCIINLGEILYITERNCGLLATQKVLALVNSLPIDILDVDRDLVQKAAHVKANHALSYADAFIVAIASQEKAIILTGDPEFITVADMVKIEWITNEL